MNTGRTILSQVLDFVSRYEFDKCVEIFKALLSHIEKDEEFKKYYEKVKSLLASSLFLYSTKLYYAGKIQESIKYRKEFHALTPNEYGECMSEAVFQISKKNNPKLALEYVNRAEMLSNGDGTWKYNKFYLLICLEKFEDALEILNDILSTTFKFEVLAINQVIVYKKKCLNDDPSHIQSNFIIGVFEYKKLNNPIIAYEKLEQFIKDTDSIENWNILNEKANELLKEINEIINMP